MGRKEFNEQVLDGVSRFLGKEAEVSLRTVVKNNGVKLDGLVIGREGNNLSPTIYLEAFYREYGEGKKLGNIVYDIVKIYDRSKSDICIDMDFFKEYDKVRSRLFCKLVNYRKNAKQLEGMPYIRFLDLAAVCYYSYMNDVIGSGTILIYCPHFERWGVTKEEMFRQAMENTRKYLGYDCRDMQEILREALADKVKINLEKYMADMEEEEKAALPEGWMQELIDKLLGEQEEQVLEKPMYILSNRGRFLGASCLLFTEILEEVGEKLSASYFILPSSIHELILVPDGGKENREKLTQMVREVNATQVEPEEVLSDAVYYYDRSSRETFLLN